MIDLKQAYIDHIICHHFSIDRTRNLVNQQEMSMVCQDIDALKNFFIKPFARQKLVYSFVHSVNLDYNVVYNTVLSIHEGNDFVKDSISIFKHLDHVSTSSTIKDGDIFIAKIEDVLLGDSFLSAVGIFKIESKKDFIETYVDEKGNLQFSVKSGFLPNKLDKACLVVFTKERPIGYIIDTGKDTKFWRQDFLGMKECSTSYSQSRDAFSLLEAFINEKLSNKADTNRSQQLEMINQAISSMSSEKKVNLSSLTKELFKDAELLSEFKEFKHDFELKKGLEIKNEFSIDTKALVINKNSRRIKLDDTAEIYLLKTGSHIERGYDEEKGLSYYKLFFSIEK